MNLQTLKKKLSQRKQSNANNTVAFQWTLRDAISTNRMKKILFLAVTVLLVGAGCSKTNNTVTTGTSVPVVHMNQGNPNEAASNAVGTPGPGSGTPKVFGDTAIIFVSEEKKSEPINLQASLPYTLAMSVTEQEWRNPSTTVSISFPVMTHKTAPAVAEFFNATVEKKVRDTVDEFMYQVADWGAEETSSPMDNFISVSVSARTANEKVLSMVVDTHTYFAGAAHPNHATVSMNIDLEQKRELTLDDFFVSGKNYIAKLSEVTIAQLKANPDGQPESELREWNDDWLNRGAGPNEVNYHTVTIAPEGFYIEFDAYDIDSYAAGPTEVVIPYSQLSGYVSARVFTLVK